MLSNISTNYNVNTQGTPSNSALGVSKLDNTTVSTLERSPKSDNITLSSRKQKKNKVKVLGGIAAAVLGAVLLVKGHKAYKINQGIKEIEQKFVKLEEDLPKAQKTFKEVFLRNDISEQEAIEILRRYKEIEKIRVKGTKEEYAKALFDEAKHNYGLADTKIRMEYDDLSKLHKGGGYAPSFEEVEISSSNPTERLMNVIHHELRHVKQAYFAVNMQPERYVQAIKESQQASGFAEYMPGAEEILKPFNMTKPNKDIVPSEYANFVEDVIKGAREHVSSAENHDAYWNNPLEIDARFAGESIAKLFGLMTK